MIANLFCVVVGGWLLWWLCKRDERQSSQREAAIEARVRVETEFVNPDGSAASADDASR